MRARTLAGVAVLAIALASIVWSLNRPLPAEPPVTAAALTRDHPTRVPRLHLPRHPTVLFIGDSLAAAYAVRKRKLDGRAHGVPPGFADRAGRRLGWHETVLAVPGIGYLNKGDDGRGTFAQRLGRLNVDRHVDLVVLQGGLSDEPVLEAHPHAPLIPAVDKTLSVVARTFPMAQVLLMGPLSPVSEGGTDDLQDVDAVLASAAQRRGDPYISPTMQVWFTQRNLRRYVDKRHAYRLTPAGEAYLSRRFVADVRKIS